MADPNAIQLPGTPVRADQLNTRLGRELLQAVQQDADGSADVVDLRRVDSAQVKADFILLNVRPEVPSHPVYPIRYVEPLAFLLPDDPDQAPEVMAWRSDFPAVPHLMRSALSFFGSLCLFDRPFQEYRARLSGRALLLRTLTWLKLTARGTLHPEDQPLEPLMFRGGHILILPDAVTAQTFATLTLVARPFGNDPDRRVILPAREGQPATPVVLLHHTVHPMTHGVIRREPRTLGDLVKLLRDETGTDLVVSLRAQLKDMYGQLATVQDHPVVILLLLLKTRVPDGPVMATERVAFFLGGHTLSDLGAALDVWDVFDDHLGLTFDAAPDPAKYTALPLESTQVVVEANRAQRAWMSGLPVSERRTVAFGAGALGSHIISNMIRAGQGRWLIVDDDLMLPHNFARHVAFGSLAGENKGVGLAGLHGLTFDDADVRGWWGTALKPDAELQAELDSAEVILEFTASAPVSRRLATTGESARRASAFLNPSGQDLVVLVESLDRTIRLDHLEHRYYQALVDQDELSDHYASVPAHLWYSGGCRDRTAQLPQDLVALHAATASRALNRSLGEPDAHAALWRAQDDGSVTLFKLPTGPYVRVQASTWTIHVDPGVLAQARKWRDDALALTPPVETGGTLSGSIDLDRREIYVTGLLPPPPDSRHYPAAFERGKHDLESTFEYIESRTAGALTYVGEWHTHPRGATATPSRDDHKLLEWLSRLLRADGQPGVMLIIGEDDVGWHVQNAGDQDGHGQE